MGGVCRHSALPRCRPGSGPLCAHGQSAPRRGRVSSAMPDTPLLYPAGDPRTPANRTRGSAGPGKPR
jgi:hypothetical protein